MKRLLQILRGYMEDMGRRYTLVLLDVDFFLRYCVRFSSAECARIMRDINGYLTVAFGNTAKVLSSEGDEFAVLGPGCLPQRRGGAGRSVSVRTLEDSVFCKRCPRPIAPPG